MPTAAASFATSSRNAAADSGDSDSGMTDAPRSTPASDIILHMLKNTGSIVYVALLHGLPAIFDAATKNVLTGWWLFQQWRKQQHEELWLSMPTKAPGSFMRPQNNIA
jgi:hypothetical protein